MNGKMVALAVIVVVCVAAAILYMNRGDVVGKVIERKIAKYLESAEDIEEFSVKGITYKDGQLDFPASYFTTNNGKVSIASAQATGVSPDAKTAEKFVINGLRLDNVSLGNAGLGGATTLTCTVDTISTYGLDLSKTEELIDKNIIYPLPVGAQSVELAGLSCNTSNNELSFSLEYAAAEGQFSAGEIPTKSSSHVTNMLLNVMGTDVRIPEMIAEELYDADTDVASFVYQPMLVEGLFLIELDGKIADYKKLIEQYAQNPLGMYSSVAAASNSVSLAYLHMKLDDRGFANTMFAMVGTIMGDPNPANVKQMLEMQLSASTAAFLESYENGLAIQQALVDYVRMPDTFEIIMAPDEPVVFSADTAEDMSLYLGDYGISIAINEGEPVEIR